MRPIGFSTGALSRGDFRRALKIQSPIADLRAVELSALRAHELEGLVAGVGSVDLERFDYVSVHAPSKLSAMPERTAIDLLTGLPAEWPLIVHPELISTPELWRPLGRRVCLENMDMRKSFGRTVEEMHRLFELLPEATFCLDLGHVRQVDPTFAFAIRMLAEFKGRLKQLHVSEVGPRGEHLPLSALALHAYQLVSGEIPAGCAIIIESVVEGAAVPREVSKCRALFDREHAVPRSFPEAVAMAANA